MATNTENVSSELRTNVRAMLIVAIAKGSSWVTPECMEDLIQEELNHICNQRKEHTQNSDEGNQEQ